MQMNPLARLVGMILFVVAGLGALLLIPSFAADTILAEWVTPKEGDTAAWAGSLLQSGLFTGAILLLIDVLWFGLAQWGWRVSDYRQADKRAVWLVLAVVAAVATAMFAFWTSAELEAGFFPMVFLFYLLAFFWGFYLATAWFTPAAFKYTPLFADRIRRL